VFLRTFTGKSRYIRATTQLLRGETTINKKLLWIIAAILVLAFGKEALLIVIEEISVLALEWGHKSLDLLFADVLGLEDDVAQRASAWTGMLLLVGLVAWLGHVAHQKFLQIKAAAPGWWARQKASWEALPWLANLICILSVIGVVGLLAMIM
jgi:hypothetical protein